MSSNFTKEACLKNMKVTFQLFSSRTWKLERRGEIHQSFFGDFFSCMLDLTTHNNLVIRALYQEGKIIPTNQILSDLSDKNTCICNCIPTDQIGIYLCISMLPQFLSDKLNSISTASTKVCEFLILYLHTLVKMTP